MSKQNNYRTYANYRKQYYRCMGRVNKLARVNHNKHTVLLEKLKLVYPLPSKRDLKKAEAKTSELELKFSKYGKEDWYKRDFNYLRYFLTIISKTYPKSAKVLSDKLKLIKPNIET